MYINKERENGNILKARKNGDGNSDSAEVIARKTLLGVEGVYSEPLANSRFKPL